MCILRIEQLRDNLCTKLFKYCLKGQDSQLNSVINNIVVSKKKHPKVPSTLSHCINYCFSNNIPFNPFPKINSVRPHGHLRMI